jgi:DNA-binding IclR family transcriptional regulator
MDNLSRGPVKSADRVLDVFELLAMHGRSISHSEISHALSIPKSSLTQLLRNLQDRGYLAFDEVERKYLLGPRFAELAERNSQTDDLIELARPLLLDVTRATGESSALNVRDGDQLKVVATAHGDHRLISHMRLGDLAPLHATSGGKAILAFLPYDAVEAHIARIGLPNVTAATITRPDALYAQLASVRSTHVADVFEEFTPGIVGIAMPVLSSDGYPLASLNVAMPSVRYNEQARARVIQALRRAVTALQLRMTGQLALTAEPDRSADMDGQHT